MAQRDARDRRRILFQAAGAVVGVAVGILVSVTTDNDVTVVAGVGLVLGTVLGWLCFRLRDRQA